MLIKPLVGLGNLVIASMSGIGNTKANVRLSIAFPRPRTKADVYEHVARFVSQLDEKLVGMQSPVIYIAHALMKPPYVGGGTALILLDTRPVLSAAYRDDEVMTSWEILIPVVRELLEAPWLEPLLDDLTYTASLELPQEDFITAVTKVLSRYIKVKITRTKKTRELYIAAYTVLI